MIRINLIGELRPGAAAETSPHGRRISLAVLVVSLAAAAAILWVGAQRLSAALGEKNQRIHELEADRSRLQQVAAQVRQFEEEKAALQQHLSVVSALQTNRTGGAELLESVAGSVVRTDAVWLTSVTRKGDDLTFEGQAGSITAVANFITQLKLSGYFDHVEIKETKEDDTNPKAATFSFQMTAQAHGGGDKAGEAPGKSS